MSLKPNSILAASFNNSLNASLHLNATINDSNAQYVLQTTNIGNQNTPNKRMTPGKLTPSRTLKPTASANVKKTPKTPCNGSDRYIPNRSAMNLEISHFLVTQTDPACKENQCGSPQKANAVSEALNGDLNNYRILCYQEKPQVSSEGSGANLKPLYSSSKYSSTKKASRFIPTQPERILDAPEVKNDYYLQLLEWSDSNNLAVALNRELYIWNAEMGTVENLVQLPEGEYISSVSWAEGANNLAVGTSQAHVQLWDVEQKKKLRTMRGHSGRVGSLSWKAFLLSSGSRTGAIFHHDVRVSDHHVGTLAGHSQEVCGLKWSPSGQYLASGSNDNLVNVWSNDMTHDQDYKPIYSFEEHQSAVKAVSWCPWKPNLLATGGGTADRRIRIWNTNNGANLYTVDTQSQVCAILWSKEYNELISAHGYANNELVIWKYPGLTKVAELTGHTARILGMSMSPEGTTVASLGADETLRFWECFQVDKDTKKKAEVKAYKEKIGNNQMRLVIR